MSHHGMMGLKGLPHFCNFSENQNLIAGNFGRLFPGLPPLYTDPDILRALGDKNGPMKETSSSNRTNTVPVGQVFFGQFVDHDITLDTSSSFSRVNSATDTPNVRTPNLDLDCIYGDGPEASPFLYEQGGTFGGVKLLVGSDVASASPEQAEDLVRSPRGTAVIGDPRNDENRIISQIQLAMIRFHNKVADELSPEYSGHDLYEETRDLVTRHYHWALIHDFLNDMCGSAVVWDVLKNGRRFYCVEDNQPLFIPVEFSIAAYRFGHSMAPQKIQVQKSKSALSLFGSVLGGGFTPVTSLDAVVDMHEIFNTSENRIVQKADKLDTKLAKILLDLPFVGAGGESSLATRNMLRGQSFLIPSGEVLAKHMERPQAEIDQVSDAANTASGGTLNGGTPLWYYLLAEAEIIGRESSSGSFDKGEGLGPVGARIVAEVIIGLMELDEHAFLGMDRSWSPKDGLGENVKGVGDILTY